MAGKTEIEWTEHTWNPTTGCTKVSQGCKHCYAEVMARRLRAMGLPGYEQGFQLTLHERRLDQPLKRRKPTVYFVNSMSDLFHEEIPDSYLDRVFQVIDQSPQHTFQILTKRAARLPHYFAHRSVPKNVWLGVSVEDRQSGIQRIEFLRSVVCRIRFISCEPLLEDLGELDMSDIHWAIVGGESGPRARRMQPEWVASLRRQCDRSGALFFFKQWGGWGADGARRSKKANGRVFDGRLWNDVPRPGVQEFS
jgi:protein gp37